MKTILGSRKQRYMVRVGIFLVVAALIVGMAGCDRGSSPGDVVRIYDWDDLDAIRHKLRGSYLLMNDLTATTAGYGDRAGPDANGGKGWGPIGTYEKPFTGRFNGGGNTISDLFIDRPDNENVGLFGYVREGVIKNVGVVGASVTGGAQVGALVGYNWNGTVESDASSPFSTHSTGKVAGKADVGGLVGYNHLLGIVSLSQSSAEVSSESWRAGGLVGHNWGKVLLSTYSGQVTGDRQVGGLVGLNKGHVMNSDGEYTVVGRAFVGGVAGWNLRTGGLQNVKFNGDVNGVPLSGVLTALSEGNTDSSLSSDTVPDGWYVGGVVGFNEGTVEDCSAAGSVTGISNVGGLVGGSDGIVNSSYFATGSVIGADSVGGLVGSGSGALINSFYDYSSVLINGENVVTAGALYNQDFHQWLAENKTLDVDKKLSQEDGYYLINDVSDLKQLLLFGQDGSLKFRLKSDLDLANDPGFYIPYLAGEFDGNGYAISNLSFNSRSVSRVGLFGYLDNGAVISGVGVEMVNVTGSACVGALVGENRGGTVHDCYSTGSVNGEEDVGGLVGQIWQGTVSHSWSSVDVTLHGEARRGGGLVGSNLVGGLLTLSEYRGGAVTGQYEIGGLVGFNEGRVLDCQATGTVTGVVHAGGVVGRNLGTVHNSLFTGNVNQVPDA